MNYIFSFLSFIPFVFNINTEIPKSDIHNCQSIDFLRLNEIELQTQFFNQLDAILRIQYPNNENREADIFVDLNVNLLNQFLKDIDGDLLTKNGKFEKEYDFNIAPEEYYDSEKCNDKISIQFDKTDCSFRMVISNSFLAEPNWCTESTIIYAFKIIDNHIVDFNRNAAG